MNARICFATLFLWPFFLISQNGDWILHHDIYHYVDRLDVLGYAVDGLPTAIKPYGREAVGTWIQEANTLEMSDAEWGWHQRMLVQGNDSIADAQAGSGFLNVFGNNQRDLYSVRTKEFRMYANPVLFLSGGIDQNTDPAAADASLPLYNNLRGLVLRGSIGEKIGFHTEAGDYLARVPEFRYRQFRELGSIPGEEEIKQFGDQNGINYFKTRAYITAEATDWLRIKFGKDRAHWGNGWQSLILSDHAADAFLLNLTANIWKFQYVSQFAQLIDYIPGKPDVAGDFPRKYAAIHALNFRPNPHISFGVFESLMYGQNQPYGRRGFELQYLNPVMFYRSVEQLIGSPDNATIGANLKVNLFDRIQLYGQALIDDFNFGNRTQGPGYWGNQWAVQAGLKYYNAFGIPTLDLQVETNHVRPYVYQHYSVVSNLSHYGESIGHAAGANVQDAHAILRYHPHPAWNLQIVASAIRQGLNLDDQNYGSDILSTYNLRPYEFGHTIGQGLALNVRQLWGRLSWQLGASEAYLEAEGRYRWERTGAGTPITSSSLLIGLRVAAVPEQIRW